MNVKELIAMLSKCDDNAEVLMSDCLAVTGVIVVDGTVYIHDDLEEEQDIDESHLDFSDSIYCC